MKKYRQTKTVYAEQWFPPEDPRHTPIEGMVKIPRHACIGYSDWDSGWQPQWELQEGWAYWGGAYDSMDLFPKYQFIQPGWWVVREGFKTYVCEWFLGWELDTEEELE